MIVKFLIGIKLMYDAHNNWNAFIESMCKGQAGRQCW